MISRKKIARSLLAVFAIWFLGSSTTLADDYMFVKAAHLNVRAWASVKTKIVAVIDSWYRVTVIESLSNWWKHVLLENGQYWYVNGSYLVAAEPEYEKVTSARYTIASWKAFMRGFDLESKVAVLENWDVLEVTSEKVYLNRWIQVRVVSAKFERYVWRTWYVAKRLLAPIDGFTYEAPQPEMPAYEDQALTDPSVNLDDTSSEDTSSDDLSIEDLMGDLNSAPSEDTSESTETTTEDSTATESSESSDSSMDSELEAILKGLE